MSDVTGVLSTPRTPEHPSADQELNINDVKEIPDEEMLDLDLNPDLSTNDDDYEYGKGTVSVGSKTSKGTLNDIVDEGYDNSDDFQSRVNLYFPFLSPEKLPDIDNHTSSNRRRLSNSQQSKFIVYCDHQLARIRRKVVQSQGLRPEQGYEMLTDLILDLKKVVDFIWYSLDWCSNTELLLDQAVQQEERDYKGTHNTNFGQQQYLIQIADEFPDYLDKFSFKALDRKQLQSTFSRVFTFMKTFDMMFVRLLDGKMPGQHGCTLTEKVRIAGVVRRTRYKMQSIIHYQLLQNWGGDCELIQEYDHESNTVYEKTMQRCM
ncbi:TFIIH complex subunit TFB6 Ecym_5039 [Eremothecium cymbalariae DBVPG|uniref:Uncharacterized protein n=1 Tax=Eremothecium cymbalariae (strain CBS 270.75 / DBVPG 7215 / KCTC 17166 / NRRL Y-17582) TaxID=931890 RepID=I6NCP4_ERECY|nr:hypothetical protein Ecym_5039 [Eremothecium cymbalariae DBVPG\